MQEPTGRTVLVVDDQEDERRIQQAFLSHRGFRVAEAADGVAALERAFADPPDLVLLDVAMPRMDGFEVCRTLREDPRTSDVAILLLTASVVGELEERARAAGADGILTKPIDPHEVAAAVERLLADRPG